VDAVPTTDALTVGAVARRLGTSIDAIVRLVYDGELTGRPDPATGRLLVTDEALAAFQDTRQSDG
jgi:hypothetical protein